MLLYLIYLDKFHRLYSLSFERIERIAWILFFHSTFFNVILHTVSTNIKYWGIFDAIFEFWKLLPVRILVTILSLIIFLLIYSFHNFFPFDSFRNNYRFPNSDTKHARTDRQTDKQRDRQTVLK